MYWHKKRQQQQQILKGILHAYFCCLTKKKSFFSNGFHFFKVFSVACRIKNCSCRQFWKMFAFQIRTFLFSLQFCIFFWVKHFTFFVASFSTSRSATKKNVWHFNARKKATDTNSTFIFFMDFLYGFSICVFFSLVLFRIEGMLSSWFGCFICHFFRMALLFFFAVGKDYVECSILGIGK